MANTINAIQCSTNLKNTGVCDCFFDPKLIIGKIMGPKSRVLTQAEVNDIQATLEALALDTRANRIFPVQGFTAVTDGTEDPTFQTFGYGSTAPVKEGLYSWVFEFLEGGVNLSNSLRSFNGQSSKYGEMYITSDNVLIGTKKKDASNQDGLGFITQEGGYPYTYPWKVNDGSKVTSYRTQSKFKAPYINENIAFVKIPTETYLLSELFGLEDVDLSFFSIDQTHDTLVVRAHTECGADLYDDFADELATATAWIIKNAAGTPIAHTVAKNDADKGWLITYTGGAQVLEDDTVTMAAPSVLAATPINVSGFESDTITVNLQSS